MKTIPNIIITGEDGQPFKDEKGLIITSVYAIKAVFNNTNYPNRDEQRQADRIYDKLDVLPADAKQVDLEDAEFDIIFKYSISYPGFLRGRDFVPFLNSLEEVKSA